MTIGDIVGIGDGVGMHHSIIILPLPLYGSDLDIVDLGPPEALDGSSDLSWGINEVSDVMGDTC